MRQLIDVSFKDVTSYPAQASGDVGGIVITHPWGPANEIRSYNLEGFLRDYPLIRNLQLSESYLNAYRAFLSGLKTIEVVRKTAVAEKYLTVDLSLETPIQSSSANLESLTRATIAFKYPGNMPLMYDTTYSDFQLVITTVGAALSSAGDFDVTVALQALNNYTGDTEVIEEITGGSVFGQQIDGVDWFIRERINQNAKYLQFIGENLGSITTATTVEVDLTALEFASLYSGSLSAYYPIFFSDIEVSQATILIDPGIQYMSDTTNGGNPNDLIATVEGRSDCVAIIGYDTGATFDKATIKNYKSSISPSMFAAFYATREQFKLFGYTYTLNGAGTIAGRIANVANTESINQLPSAKTWGTFGAPISKTLTFAEVLEMHDLGINSVYSTVSGPRIYGLKSLYARQTSYFSKFNVGRVCSRILRYAFSIAMDAIHTGNTDQKKALVQNLLNSDLNRLKAQGALRPNSSVRCDNTNNSDLDTNGGEILIISYDCWFVKLIERVSISILATDSSVSAVIKQN